MGKQNETVKRTVWPSLMLLTLVGILENIIFQIIASNKNVHSLKSYIFLTFMRLTMFILTAIIVLYKNKKLKKVLRKATSKNEKYGYIIETLNYMGLRKNSVTNAKYIIVFGLIIAGLFGITLKNGSYVQMNLNTIIRVISIYLGVLFIFGNLFAIFNLFSEVTENRLKLYLFTFLTSYVGQAVVITSVLKMPSLGILSGVEVLFIYFFILMLVFKIYESCNFSLYIPWFMYSTFITLALLGNKAG